MNNIMIKCRCENENANAIISSFLFTSFIYDEDDNYIERFGLISGDECEYIESADGEAIKISNLKCKTYDELIVQLDLHNALIYNQLDKSTTSCSTSNEKLMLKLKRLEQENLELKTKLTKVKEFLKR